MPCQNLSRLIPPSYVASSTAWRVITSYSIHYTKLYDVVGASEVCVQDIVEAVGTSQSNISQHLAILRDKGVLLTRKDANRVYYRVGDPRTLQLIALMREVFCDDTPFKP